MFIKQYYNHKPSASVWKTFNKNGYAQRMARAYEIFYPTGILKEIKSQIKEPKSQTIDRKTILYNRLRDAYSSIVTPGNPQIVADVGCGPLSGIFVLKKYNKMYAVEPSWSKYRDMNLIQPQDNVTEIESYAEKFVLPEKVDLIWSINALNHGGCLCIFWTIHCS